MSSTAGDGRDVSAGLAGLMAQLQSSLGGALSGQASGGRPPPGQGAGGHGQAAGGAVRAQVSPAGRLEALTIDPSLLRSGVVSVADAVLTAVQAAQDDAARGASGSGDGGPALEALDAEALSEAAEVAQQGMVRFDQMLSELEQLSRRLGQAQP